MLLETDTIPISKQIMMGLHILALGGASLLAGIYLFRSLKQKKTLLNHAEEQLLRDLEEAHKLSEGIIHPLQPSKIKLIKDETLAIKVTYIPSLAQKQKLPCRYNQTRTIPINPFMPPFEKGKFICELPPSHRLLFCKYYLRWNHLLLVTKEFEEQTLPLGREDLQQSIYLSKMLKGFFFFNCGQEASFSQRHKHIQFLPEQEGEFPIYDQINSHINENKLEYRLFKGQKIYQFKHFNFAHGIVLLDETTSSQTAKMGYDNVMSFMKEVLGREFSHNVVGSRRFILVAPRRNQYFWPEKVSVNGSVFCGLVFINKEEYFDELQKSGFSPAVILEKVGFPWPENMK